MEDLIRKLGDYARYLALEDSIPYWQQQRSDLKVRLGELRLSRDRKQWELDHLENPGFFQRLLGKAEEKKEKLTRQVSQVKAALNAARWELEELDKKLEEAMREKETLCGSREAYALAKQEAVLTTMEESQLMMQEIAAFAPAAITAADRVLEALEDARPWMQQDVRYTGVSAANRKLECLTLAAENARRLVSILETMPQGCADVGGYLQSPEGYVDAVTMEYVKLDRLNSAIGQVRQTRNQLGMLQ